MKLETKIKVCDWIGFIVYTFLYSLHGILFIFYAIYSQREMASTAFLIFVLAVQLELMRRRENISYAKINKMYDEQGEIFDLCANRLNHSMRLLNTLHKKLKIEKLEKEKYKRGMEFLDGELRKAKDGS